MSLVTADKVDRYDDLQLPVHLQVRTRFSSATEGVAETLSIFARVQAAFSIVGIVIFFSLAAHQDAEIWAEQQIALPRLVALLFLGAFTHQVFKRDWFGSRKASPLLRRAAVALQLIWLSSELAFKSAFAPLILAVSPTLDYSPLGIFVLKLLPFSLMGGLTSCLSFFSGFRRGRRHRRLASIESGELNRLHVQVGSSAEVDSSACTTAYATPPMSPADSCSSASSGALCSGLPSPTGHCRSPDRAASGQAENLADVINSCDIYLKMHVLDTNETVMFVHKKLKPIRTKIGEDPPPSDYKPLLRTLIEQSAAKHATQAPQPAPALPYAPVVATIRIVNGKGVVSPVNNAAVIPVCA